MDKLDKKDEMNEMDEMDEMDEMELKYFGLTCKKLRKDKGFSQQEFSHKINMDRSYYAAVEKGKKNITLRNIWKIIKGFGESYPDFFKAMESIKDTEKTENTKNKGFMDTYLGRRILKIIVFMMKYYIPTVIAVSVMMMMTVPFVQRVGLVVLFAAVGLSVFGGSFSMAMDIILASSNIDESTLQLYKEYIHKMTTMVVTEMIIYVCFFVKLACKSV